MEVVKYTEKQQQRKPFHILSSKEVFYRNVIKKELMCIQNTSCLTLEMLKSEMLQKAERLKDHLNESLHDFDFKHRCLNQKRQLAIDLASMQSFEHIYEQSVNKPVQFLMRKTTRLTIFQNFKFHTNQNYFNMPIITEEDFESVTAILLPEIGKRKYIENEQPLKPMPRPELFKFFIVPGENCRHISNLKRYKVWVSDKENIVLTNMQGDNLYSIDNVCAERGVHTVNKERELIFIDGNCNIRKLSNDMKTTTTLVETANPTWRPGCVCWSPFAKDLLVGMYREDIKTGKVSRYNQSGQETQTIQHDNTGLELYKKPYYITENNNGDVVVSDFLSAVIVTERGGRYRFSYTGPSSESGLWPSGICTDALLNILVCDIKSRTVQLIDMNGQFMLYLLVRPPGIFHPCSLSYDVKTDRLWVGSDKNRMCVYRYLTRQTACNDHDSLATANVVLDTETKTPQDDLPRMLVSPLELTTSLTVPNIRYGCFHISCVTPNLAWVSDKYSLVLINIEGKALDHLEKETKASNSNGLHTFGLHTVNGDGELIYIDDSSNIKQFSKDKETTTLIKTTDSSWSTGCVVWSQSTGDLLVGMFRKNPITGKVIRYNQSGQIKQEIQQDNTGMDIYRQPRYITENSNGDVVVSDSLSAVVVTDREGRYRFSYPGHPSGSELELGGICTDAYSNILVCDVKNNSIHVIDMDGDLFSNINVDSKKFQLCSLAFDVKTETFWVGYNGNFIDVFSYKTRQNAFSDHVFSATADVIQTTEFKNSQDDHSGILISPLKLTTRLRVPIISHYCSHISCVTSNLAWVSDNYHLILVNMKGDNLLHLEKVIKAFNRNVLHPYGLHTVNSKSELIYIDNSSNIKKFSKKGKTTTLIKTLDSIWSPYCVFGSKSTGDLLVGMFRKNPITGKVIRYNQSGQIKQEIQQDNTGMDIYRQPRYITENTNGDVVVSDSLSAVVVTDREGRHLFSYTSPPSGSGLEPSGICTDAYSHILVCNLRDSRVHIIDKDGRFLAFFSIKDMHLPCGISYDNTKHCFWVVQSYNKVNVYRNIAYHVTLADKQAIGLDGDDVAGSGYPFRI